MLILLQLGMALNQTQGADDHHDDRSIAIRRKRRISSGLGDRQQGKATGQEPDLDSASKDRPRQQPRTPRHHSKRVRFSDSCLDIAGTSSSTGLTPALVRTRLLNIEPSEKQKSRRSLPARFTTADPSPVSPTSPKSPASGEFQFAPLRQVLDARTARRLRRNHFSEEMNDIYKERSSKYYLQKEIEDLKDEIATAKQDGYEARETGNVTREKEDRIEQLEDEILTLKEKMRERSGTADILPPSLKEPNDSNLVAGPEALDQDVEEIIVDIQQDEHGPSLEDEHQSLTVRDIAEASTQACLPPPDLIDILRSARLALEHLFPGEITLDLDISDPRPLFETTISWLRTLKTEYMKVENRISVSQTSTANMERNFNAALAQLEHARNQFQSLKNELAEERSHAQNAELEVSTLQAQVDNVKDKCEKIERERDEHLRSIERLQPALTHYQEEVQKLTQAFLDLENSHKEALSNLRLEYSVIQSQESEKQKIHHEQAISDLEAHVAAETEGRRIAEASAVNRLDQIKELEDRQQELKMAINEKQSIIRELETKIGQLNEFWEQEAGQLNVRIGDLVSNLSAANADVAALRLEKSRLSKIVDDERAAGLKAVTEMRSEMSKCAKTVENVSQEHVDGVEKRAEETQKFQGLLTPIVDGGRFRDAEQDDGQVEGFVQVGRGKGTKTKRPDSGIEIWDDVIFEGPEDDDVVMVENR